MTKGRKVVIGAGAAFAALGVYLFWYMSPFEQCVRAETSIGAERQIKLRDEQERLLPGEYLSDDEIWEEQKRLAVLNCKS